MADVTHYTITTMSDDTTTKVPLTSTGTTDENAAPTTANDKGKGKAPTTEESVPIADDEDMDDEEEEESGLEEEHVCLDALVVAPLLVV